MLKKSLKGSIGLLVRLRTDGRSLWRGLDFRPIAVIALVMVAGCSSLRPKPATEYVYVTAKQTFLRDRVAAVSNRTGEVTNGQRLEILEHGRRFFRVKTDKGEMGWIDEKAVVTQPVYDEFQELGKSHAKDAAVALGLAKDEVNLHLTAGRDTEKFYRLGDGDKVQLLERATLPKPVAPGTPKAGMVKGVATPMPVAMEDWWLVRDAQGRAGWMLSSRVEVDAPNTLTRYAEGQRFVGAYVLSTVHDEGASGDGVPESKDIPMYLTVLNSYVSGLPYDFNQVRVFTWNVKMHRYETAYRQKNIEGFLPVEITKGKDPNGKGAVAEAELPTFTFRVLAADAGPVVPDPETGVTTPGRTISKTFRLEGNVVRRIGTTNRDKEDVEAHPVVEEKKKVGKKK